MKLNPILQKKGKQNKKQDFVESVDCSKEKHLFGNNVIPIIKKIPVFKFVSTVTLTSISNAM